MQAIEAVQKGDSETLLRLITTDPGVVDATNPEGVSLVSFAVYNSRKELADLLAKHGATLDIFSASACHSMNKAVEILTSRPQLIHAYSADGWTPLHLAAFFGHDLLVEFYVAFWQTHRSTRLLLRTGYGLSGIFSRREPM